MDTVHWYGAMITVAALAGLLASELVGTAHAARGNQAAYAWAISAGAGMELRQRQAADGVVPEPASGAAQTHGRSLLCRSVVGFAGFSVGYDCRSV